MVEQVPGGLRRNIQSTCTKDDRQASACSKFRSRYRTLSTTTSRLLLYRAAGRCRIALLFSRSRGARALSACVFRGRRRAAGGCPCRTIFHALPPPEVVPPSSESPVVVSAESAASSKGRKNFAKFALTGPSRRANAPPAAHMPQRGSTIRRYFDDDET